MTLRDFVLAGVLPISFLAPASSASFLHEPDFSPPAPLFLAQADISPERIAAREQYELALQQLERAEQALSKAEKAGGDRDAEQLAAAQAEKELLKARRVLVELVMYDIPRSLLEEEAFRAERSAQAHAATAEGRTEAGSSAEVLAEKGTSGTREGDADRGARTNGNDQSSERAALRASGAEKSVVEAEVQTADTEEDGPVAEVESELAVPPEVQILQETVVEDAPAALDGEGTDVDLGLRRGERRREERSAAAGQAQEEGGLARSNAEAGERSDGEQPVASEQARPQSMAETLHQTTKNQSQTTINQSVDTNQSTVNQTLGEQTVQQQQVIEGKRGRAANVKGEARLSPLERMRRRVGLPRLY